MKTQIAVVGSGIAGLSCAALAARGGKSVVLFEHHDKPGGCTGDFTISSKWGDFCFPTGATAILGLENGGLHDELFRVLEISCAAQNIEKLRVFLPDCTLDWHSNPEFWRRERAKLRGNRGAQELFWFLQERVADAGWFALQKKPFLPLQTPRDLWRNLPLAHPKIVPMIAALPFSVGELIKVLRLENDRQFVALVNLALLITVQSPMRRAPLSNGLAGLDLWRHGAFHPVGGAGKIAWKLLEGFEKWGGETRFSTRVVGVSRERGGWKIETTNGEFWAETVVWNGEIPFGPHFSFSSPSGFSGPHPNPPPQAGEGTRQLGTRETSTRTKMQVPSPACGGGLGWGPSEARSHQNSEKRPTQWGALNVYAAIPREIVPPEIEFHAHVLRAYTRRKPFFEAGDGDDVFLSISAPDETQSAPASFATLNISTHVRQGDWRGLSRLEYREKKRVWRQKLLDCAAIALPELREKKLFALCGTPSTWEDYTLRSGVGGPPLSRRNANLRAQSVRTQFPNFYRVGDGTFPGQGTVACVLSGWNAWREISNL